MINPFGWVVAVLYDLRGYERIEGEQRRRFNKLSNDVEPYEIWIGHGYGSKASFGNVVIGDKHYEKLKDPELEAVFLHEIGHVDDKAGLRLTILLIISIVASVMTWIIIHISFSISARTMGWNTLVHVIESQYVIQIVFFLSILIGVDSGLRCRYPGFEYRADEYSVKKGYGEDLISAINTKIDIDDNWIYKSVSLIRRRYYPSYESRVKKIRENMG